jgi:ABC-type amino acid transport substrate-binding protein
MNLRPLRATALLLALMTVLVSSGLMAVSAAGDLPAAQQVPTLVPPTLVPVVESGALDALPSESVVARIASSGKLRVGILFNEPPFGELNIRGEVSGFDADLARSIAEAWGVEIEFVQVTRQTGIDVLVSDEIDLLIAAQTHRRELDSRVEFSQSYYPNQKALLVREGDGAAVLAHMADRKVGVVLGTPAEQAVLEWQRRVDYAFTIQTYLTLDRAIAALTSSEIDGVVDSRVRLSRTITQPGIARFVDEPVQQEPFAIALRRQDVQLRNLVNRTLQYLFNSGRINEIHQTHFSGASYPQNTFVTWANVGDEAPRPDQAATDVPFPAQYAVPRVRSGGQLRVAGLVELPPDAPESERRLDTANRALVNALAMRWGVSVVAVPSGGANPADLVANGEADLAVGVQPDWSYADRVDFTSRYILHGLRLMIESNSNIGGFGDLRNKWVGIFASEPGVSEVIRAEAERVNAIVDDVYTIAREQDAAFAMLAENNVDAVLGNSMKLIPHIEANPEQLELLTDGEGRAIWYSRSAISMAVPRNDIDFRLLVEYTLQELAREGTLTQALLPVMQAQDFPRFEIWPGSSDYLGFSLSAAS